MEQATALIDGLAGERQRWTDDSKKFEETKLGWSATCALGCAFVSYCGPFNQDFRDYMVIAKFTAKTCEIATCPCTQGNRPHEFLVDIGTIGDWNMEGLPTDPLSIQNGILVTRSSRYPLLIDPQGQALNWIKQPRGATACRPSARRC